MCNKQLNLNKQLVQNLKNFNADKIFYLKDNFTAFKDTSYSKILAVNTNQEKVFLVDYDLAKSFTVSYNEIVNYKIYDNDNEIKLGGATGGLINTFAIFNEKHCEALKLIIRLDNPANPQVCYEIIKKYSYFSSVSRSSKNYTIIMNSLEEIISFLEVILKRNNKD